MNLYTQKEETASQPQLEPQEQVDPAKSRKHAKKKTRRNMVTSTKRKLSEESIYDNIPPTKKVNPIHTVGTPAYRAKMRRQIKQCEPDEVMTCDLTNDMTSSLVTEDEYLTTVGYENLTPQDMTLLEQRRGWLNDRLINVGQILLKNKFTTANGLQSVDLARLRTLNFAPCSYPFVQILNTFDSHWICVTTFGCKPNSVKVYDSMRTGAVSLSTKECIATLLKCEFRFILLIYPQVQQQTDASSCGLFALAFAYTLCEGQDPSQMEYEPTTFRSHFLRCIQKKSFTRFDCKASLYKPGKPLSSKFGVYCTCRLPNSGDEMVCCDTCSEWYHFTCLNNPEKPLGDTWYCHSCVQQV